MAKPVTVEVKSDDCLVTVNGEKHAVHEGESVWLFQGHSVGEMRAVSRLAHLQVQVDALKDGGDQEGAMALLAEIDALFDAICAMLAPRVVRWTWTDLRGNPMPQPDGTAAFLARLESEELFWLLQAAKGEAGGGRKNG